MSLRAWFGNNAIPKPWSDTGVRRRILRRPGTEAFLFDYPTYKDGSRARQFQKRAGKWLRTIGVTDRKLTLHSWRHRLRTLERELAMPEPVSRVILGHTMGEGEHGKYGEVPSLKLRVQWIKKTIPLKG